MEKIVRIGGGKRRFRNFSASATEAELEASVSKPKETTEEIASRIANEAMKPVREHFEKAANRLPNGDFYLPNLLKDFIGCQFYTPLFGCNITLVAIDDRCETLPLHFELNDLTVKETLSLTETGALYKGGECMVFPSEDQRDWEKWNKENKFVVSLNAFQQGNAALVGPGTHLRIHNPQELQVITDKIRQYMIELADEFNLQID